MDLNTRVTSGCEEVLSGMMGQVLKAKRLVLTELNPDVTVMAMMDMVNGFAREGPLASPRVEALIPSISRLMVECQKRQIPILAFADAHPKDSPEFDSYPPHSLAGSTESQIVDEIQEIGGYILLEKRSTNGFHEPGFKRWLEINPQRVNWILAGDCTDICIYQFATTMKTFFNTQNIRSRIIVPMNAVDTFDAGLHRGDLLHGIFLYAMLDNGIEVVSNIDL